MVRAVTERARFPPPGGDRGGQDRHTKRIGSAMVRRARASRSAGGWPGCSEGRRPVGGWREGRAMTEPTVRLARAAPRLCVCRGHVAVGYAGQREGGILTPHRRVSSGVGRAPPVRVSRP